MDTERGEQHESPSPEDVSKDHNTTKPTLRAPGTIIKPPQPSRLHLYGSYTAQNKFRTMNPSVGSGTHIRPLQMLQLAHDQHHHPSNPVPPQNQTAQSAVTSNAAQNSASDLLSRPQPQVQPPQANTKTMTRIPAKPSGLIRPTPIRQIAAHTSQQGPLGCIANKTISKSTSGQQASRIPPTMSGSSTRLAYARPQSHGLTSSLRPPSSLSPSTTNITKVNVTMTNLEKPKALPRARVPSSRPALVRPPEPEARSRTTTMTTSVITSSSSQASSSASPSSTPAGSSSQHITNIIDLSSVENDVGQIRKLLEQLLVLLQASHKDQEDIMAENESLKREVADLRYKMRAIRSTVTANRDSDQAIVAPIPFKQYPRLQQPPSNVDGRNEAFLAETTLSEASSTTVVGDKNEGSQPNSDANSAEDQRAPSSVYLSPMI